MGIRTKQVNGAVLREFFCDECNVGRYRKTLTVSEAGGHKQYEHQCTSCGDTTFFTVIYPMLEYNGKLFMLADSVRFNESTSDF